MDLDAVCAHCALSLALSLVKYVETGRTAANTATNKPSKRKNELLGATWIADFVQKQNFDVDQPALCSSCLSVLEPEFGRRLHKKHHKRKKKKAREALQEEMQPTCKRSCSRCSSSSSSSSSSKQSSWEAHTAPAQAAPTAASGCGWPVLRPISE